jgi:hypothetical protein
MIRFSAPRQARWQNASTSPVPVKRFGKDHWSTLAYIETRIVDYRGVLSTDHMRISSRRHPMLLAMKPRARVLGATSDGADYPTRLKSETVNPETGLFESENLPEHDDYDCVDDLIAAGLLTVDLPRIKNGVFVDAYDKPCVDIDGAVIRADFVTDVVEQTLMAEATFKLTPKGQAVMAELRAFKGLGGNFHQFMPSELALSQDDGFGIR